MLLSDKIKLTLLSLIAMTITITVVYCATTIGTTNYFLV